MFYYCKKDKNTTEVQKIKKICAMYGEGEGVKKWFVKFLGTIVLVGMAQWIE